QVSADGTTAYDVILLDLPPDESPDALPAVRDRLAALPPGPVDVALAGGPAFYGDIQAVSEADLRRSEIVSLPLAALALLVVFGAVVAAGLPLAVGGGALVVALALIWVVAGLTQMSIFVLNLATLLGLGLGVDYSLLMTSRFREELGRRRTADGGGADAVAEAVAVTVMTAGRAVFFSGLTVLLGLTGLILFEFPILRSVGIAGAIVVGLAVTAAVTLLPAILSVLGDRIDAGRIRQVNAAEDVDGPWARLARRVMRHPVAVFIPTLGFLLLLGAPFLHVRFNAPDATILPPDVPSRAAFDRLDAKFGAGRFAPLSLAIRTTGPATSAANVAALYDYSRRLAADPRIVRVDGFVDVDPRLTRDQYLLLYGAPTGPPDRFVATVLAATTKADLTTFTLTTPYGPNADEARRLVADLRASGGPLAAPATMTVLVGGGAADVVDVVDGIGAGFARTALFIFVSTYLVLFVLLRSVVLPAKALVMNTLSIVAAFGALVWIFQDGNLSALLGFQPLGYVETTQPVILFCILFGLSMDYEVFLLSRMKEVWDRTGDNTEAVARGLERSGRIVTSAALIVVVVAGSFAFADIVLIKAIGLGVAISVALDAT
ncbi:MAG TPA: MMPL family transporter, partial [Patescibacteria group bacterium]|nr:MMPL family transporter [Patescibacteria group bacterium]